MPNLQFFSRSLCIKVMKEQDNVTHIYLTFTIWNNIFVLYLLFKILHFLLLLLFYLFPLLFFLYINRSTRKIIWENIQIIRVKYLLSHKLYISFHKDEDYHFLYFLDFCFVDPRPSTHTSSILSHSSHLSRRHVGWRSHFSTSNRLLSQTIYFGLLSCIDLRFTSINYLKMNLS